MNRDMLPNKTNFYALFGFLPISKQSRTCTICIDKKPYSKFFKRTKNCTHSYCIDCIVRYVTVKIEENTAMIKCPDVECTNMIEPYMCRALLPKEVFERWERILCDSLISSWNKFYCPYQNCSAMMIDDGDSYNLTHSKCPYCNRLFCVQCKVTWHSGLTCREFQRLESAKKKISDEEDDIVVQMAKKKQWIRCPSCKFYVEKAEGCSHISCRCKFQFCYDCGSSWERRHRCQFLD